MIDDHTSAYEWYDDLAKPLYALFTGDAKPKGSFRSRGEGEHALQKMDARQFDIAQSNRRSPYGSVFETHEVLSAVMWDDIERLSTMAHARAMLSGYEWQSMTPTFHLVSEIWKNLKLLSDKHGLEAVIQLERRAETTLGEALGRYWNYSDADTGPDGISGMLELRPLYIRLVISRAFVETAFYSGESIDWTSPFSDEVTAVRKPAACYEEVIAFLRDEQKVTTFEHKQKKEGAKFSKPAKPPSLVSLYEAVARGRNPPVHPDEIPTAAETISKNVRRYFNTQGGKSQRPSDYESWKRLASMDDDMPF